MDTRIIPLLKTFLPRVPLLVSTALYNVLGLSEQSSYWDVKTEVVVRLLRSLLNEKQSGTITKLQELSVKDQPVKGKIWIAKVQLPEVPEDDVVDSLCAIVEELATTDQPRHCFERPLLRPVQAEWTGYRAEATADSPPLMLPEQQQYWEMMREVTTPTTILYLHGGAYFLMDPASHRATTKKLAKLTGGRCLSVRYRLAPKYPFPAALLDALVAYLFLLYPPYECYHNAVSPNHVVFSGDSAGGGLCMALLQVILALRRQGRTIRWYGQEREIPLPAGTAVNSAWLDLVQSSPSCEANKDFDYIPVPSDFPTGLMFPPCDIWPSTPARSSPYAPDALLCHPLVSPLAAANWHDCCPLYLVVGQELLTDEGRHLALKATRHGVHVVFEEYEAMPHCFSMIFAGGKGAKRCYEGWANFINTVTSQPVALETKAIRVKADNQLEVDLPLDTLSPYTDDQIAERMHVRQRQMTKAAQRRSTG